MCITTEKKTKTKHLVLKLKTLGEVLHPSYIPAGGENFVAVLEKILTI